VTFFVFLAVTWSKVITCVTATYCLTVQGYKAVLVNSYQADWRHVQSWSRSVSVVVTADAA